MIKCAATPEDYKRCWDYLNDKGCRPLPRADLFYVEETIEDSRLKIEDEKTESKASMDASTPLSMTKITACAGWSVETGGQIEPMCSDSITAAYKLFFFMQGYIVGKGFRIVRVISKNPKVFENITKEGFVLWSGFTGEHIKEFY